jgi:hypothetical protein
MRLLPTIAIAIAAVCAACGGDDEVLPDGRTQTTIDAPAGDPPMPALGTQLDRAGRPAISTALIATFEADDTAGPKKDAYNADGDPAGWSDHAAEIQEQLAIYDGLDRTCGNQLGADLDPNDRYAALAGLLADDQLYVNTASGTCTTYLAVEADALGILATDDCGGRLMAYDVIDTSYSVLAVGAFTGVGDGIDADDATHDPATFPFLAAPTP